MNAISFCLYGDDPKYINGMRENIRLAPMIYPGWMVYLSVDRVRQEFSGPNIQQVVMGPSAGSIGMKWRMMAAIEPFYAIIFRDADSRLNVREKAAVDLWLASGKLAHGMHDHRHHRHHPLGGGLWGVQGGVVRLGMLNKYKEWKWGTDQEVLTAEVWPQIKHSFLLHTSIKSKWGGEPFPNVILPDGQFVGQIFDASNKPIFPKA